ncbi:MAG: GNAT family N-acetyltransferase [Clostridia bacterium]|nr:GNAT family N-acetyltransferase [Clostridia bacterium]
MIEIKEIKTKKNIFRVEAYDTETERIVGYSELRGTEKPVPVAYCKVEELYRGKKIGSNMLKMLISYAKETNREGIFARFDGNVRAKMMLKRQGFHLYTSEIALLNL